MKKTILLTSMIICFSFCLIACCPLLGASYISPSALLNGDETLLKIFMLLRLPRVLLGFFIGGILSLCGLVFQALFKNSLASPDMLGVSSGASFGAVVYIKLSAVSSSLYGLKSGLSYSAFIGALFAMLILFIALATKREATSNAFLLLLGIVLNFMFSALTMIVQYSSGYIDTFRMMRWTMGGLHAINFSPVLLVMLTALFSIFICLLIAPALDLISCGDELAQTRGVNVKAIKIIFLFVVSVSIAIVVSISGPIGFVGLMCPHITKLLLHTNHRGLALNSFFIGGLFLVICDTLARIVTSPQELPVGVVTSCLGSLFLLLLLFRKRYFEEV